MRDETLAHLLDNLRSMLGEEACWIEDTGWNTLAEAFDTLSSVVSRGIPLGSLDAIIDTHLRDIESSDRV